MASNSDLLSIYGTDINAVIKNYISMGYSENWAINDVDKWSYLATNVILIIAYGSNSHLGSLATQHYNNFGFSEKREIDNFDEWGYLESNIDLKNAFGSDITLAMKHYITSSFTESRSLDQFNASNYLRNYANLRASFSDNQTLAKLHYLLHGASEGRIHMTVFGLFKNQVLNSNSYKIWKYYLV